MSISDTIQAMIAASHAAQADIRWFLAALPHVVSTERSEEFQEVQAWYVQIVAEFIDIDNFGTPLVTLVINNAPFFETPAFSLRNGKIDNTRIVAALQPTYVAWH